jgi:hypothetical protein
MAIELPRRIGGSPGRRRGQLAPTAENVPTVRQRAESAPRVPDITRYMAGDEAGAALQRFGQGVLMAADRQQREFDAIETTKAELEFKTKGPAELRRLQVEGDPTDPDFMKNFEDWLTTQKSEALGKVNAKVSPFARQKLELELDGQLATMRDSAGAVQIKANQQKSIDLLGQQRNIWGAQALRDPDALPFILEDIDRVHGNFAGSMTADQDRDQRVKSRQAAIQNAVSGMVNGDRYMDAEKLIGSGEYDQDLGSEALRSISADIRRGKSVARTEIRELANDHLASVAATGQGVSGLSERAAKILEPKDLADFRARETTAKQVFVLSQQIRYAAPDEMAAGLSAIAPKAGSPRFADEQRIHEGMVRQAERILKAREQDPAGYAMQAPEVAEAFKKAGDNPAEITGAVTKSLALQERMGIPAHERRVMPKAGAEAEVKRLSTMPAEQMADALQGMAMTYGKYWPRAYRELVRENLPQEAVILGTMDRPEDAVVRREFAQAVQAGRKTLTDNLGPQVKTEIDRGLHDAMEPWARMELARGATESNVQAMRSAAEMLAYSYASRGMTPAQAAQKSAEGLVGSRYDMLNRTGFSLYVPKGLGEAVTDTAERTLGSLTADDLMDPGGDQKLTPAQRKAEYLRLAKRGTWVLSEDGEGAFLVDQLGQPVMKALPKGASGPPSRLEIRFSDVSRNAPPAAGGMNLPMVP